MTDILDTLPILDEDDTAILYRLENDIFDTVALVYKDDEDVAYFLTDMQGQFPTTLEEVPEYDWCRGDEIDW